MDTIRICKQCRKPLPQNSPEGLCPECLARVALGSEPAAPRTRIPPAPAELAAQFPQLEILELLGMGGMGMVYKARQPRLDRLVALKILPIDSLPDASFAERFEREAKALAKLNHPGIVTLYDFGQTREYYYFIMEYVDGMNLRQLIQAKSLEPRQALELVMQICTALQFAHDEKIVHRDIKPENILITKKGQVKIADFGLAKLLGGQPDTALTASQMVMGTINYMAPEQRQNAQGVDHRADIYSLGVVFYEMLTGEVPMGRFEPPSKKVQIDVRLDEVVLHALEREPARRYQHVSEVKSNVETITATTPARSESPAASPTCASPMDRVLSLNLQALKSAQMDKARTALGRCKAHRVFELITCVLMAVGLGIYLRHRLTVPSLAIPALILDIFTIAAAAGAVRQLILLGEISFEEPITVIQRKTEAVKLHRLQLARLMVLSLPFYMAYVALGFDLFFGVNVLAHASRFYIYANLVVSLALLVPALWLFRNLNFRNAGHPVIRVFIKGTGGKALLAAMEFLKRTEEIEAEEQN
jgi:tRNA A-37 threonylcarbamoyl transferase component Bud32